jgi:ABC-type enterochelin transport system ATPase subunit
MSQQAISIKNSEIVFDIFKRLAEEFNQTLLIVTHDQSFASRTHRIIEMEDGRIILKILPSNVFNANIKSKNFSASSLQGFVGWVKEVVICFQTLDLRSLITTSFSVT